jgi:hypothetical protein
MENYGLAKLLTEGGADVNPDQQGTVIAEAEKSLARYRHYDPQFRRDDSRKMKRLVDLLRRAGGGNFKQDK